MNTTSASVQAFFDPAILWLLSAEASYTTMALLDVTGGR